MARRPRYTDYPRTILWLVPGGSATIGGVEPDTQPAFEAEIEPFYLSKWPITNEQFEAFDPRFERSPVSPGDRDTAVGVTFEEATAYASWYAEVSRKPMRLPTEVEWEHACRSGTSSRFFWGSDPQEADRYTWNRANSDGRAHPPELKQGNGFGLHGMLGGVWEWTDSVYRPYPPSEGPAGATAATETRRVLRGGSFELEAELATCSVRRAAAPDATAHDVGFRIARSFRVTSR